MNRNCLLIAACLMGILGSLPALTARAQQPEPIVHAVLFYSPACAHCQYVITEVLPPLTQKYGEQLQIIGFDVTHPNGQAMMYAAMDRFGLQEPVVPLLVINDVTLIGSQQIPDELPGLIETHLKLGGSDWPDIPGLRMMLAATAATTTAEAVDASQSRAAMATPAPGSVQPESATWQQRFGSDPTGNSLAVLVLVGMLAAVVWAIVRFQRGAGPALRSQTLTWLIPALCLLGVAVAAYLAYVEATDTSAVCGPVGDCNTVQQSPYSHLFGVISIGVFGLIGYVSIVVTWAWARFGNGHTSAQAAVGLAVLALVGTLFSIYLTFLEPFVIGATCAWCLTSAVIMTALLVLTAGPAGRALKPAPVTAARKPRKARSTTRPG